MSGRKQRIQPARSIRGAARDLIYERAHDLLGWKDIPEDELKAFREYANHIINNAAKLTSAIRPVISEVDTGEFR